MQLDQLRLHLSCPEAAADLLASWGLRDRERGWSNLRRLGEHLPPDRLRELVTPLARLLSRCPDPDMALNNLERFVANPAARDHLAGLLDHRARGLESLLCLFSTSQPFSDLLAQWPEHLDVVRAPSRRPPSVAELRAALQEEVDGAFEDGAVLRIFRRYRQRQLLRVGATDVLRPEARLEETTRDISAVAEAALEVALATAIRSLGERFGQPFGRDSQPATCVVLALGKLGGEELNYSSDIDLLVVYGDEGQTRGTRGKRVASIGNDEFFGRVVTEVIRLLGSHSDRGPGYRIDLRLRPEGQRGALARSLASTLSYYDNFGRTWERQALIKVRPVAGDRALGARFLAAVEPFVYRKYLTFAEINEIKALKRLIEQKASRAGTSDTEVKTGHGGIRDIEFTVQFLQLLNGGDLPSVRQRNTLAALQALADAGCLHHYEWEALHSNYRLLREVEHRLQLLFDLQTHRLPEGDDLRRLALQLGHASAGDGPQVAFLADYRARADRTRDILEHLLHETFADGQGAEPEADLMLDPNPEPDTVRAVLGRYPFRDIPAAYDNLQQLATESVPFLSHRRCRHFLASIVSRLLCALAKAPDPDMALNNLEKVSRSLGGKTVLWELFSEHPQSLRLYVDLCAWSEFLSDILINNPGMIDELLDSLVLNQPRLAEELRGELAELCRGATDLDPILHSFQDKELLRIGVRHILDKAPIRATTRALSDLAEVVLERVALAQFVPMEKRYGVPLLAAGPRAGQPARFAILALGKLGSREMSYHSDLDLMMLYEGDGRTAPPPGSSRFDRHELTDNFHYFTELAQRFIKATSALGPMGRLYAVDMRLRPTGKSGTLVLPLCEFRRYFAVGGAAHPDGGGQLWERQALTRARVVFGDADFAAEVTATVEAGAYGLEWRPALAAEVRAMRERLEASRPSRDLKRGPGGLADVEFLVEALQLRHARDLPVLRAPNTWDALDGLRQAGLLSDDEHDVLEQGYNFLLRVQGRLRIVHNRIINAIPEAPAEVEKLARRLGFKSGPAFLAQLERHTSRVRELFLRRMAQEAG